ncbi:hypothetical protein DL98DRAFT_529938 [Cadophora sp. DSE1049]|nr:hypothetical protein DL98DRAFT_529938 [Cadophora sp. DSE1049]
MYTRYLRGTDPTGNLVYSPDSPITFIETKTSACKFAFLEALPLLAPPLTMRDHRTLRLASCNSSHDVRGVSHGDEACGSQGCVTTSNIVVTYRTSVQSRPGHENYTPSLSRREQVDRAFYIYTNKHPTVITERANKEAPIDRNEGLQFSIVNVLTSHRSRWGTGARGGLFRRLAKVRGGGQTI